MVRKALVLFALLALVISPALAQEEEIPTIAMMNFGYSAGQTLADQRRI